MIAISNSWKHPRTSFAGVLIAVATVAGVLAQQGITLGNVGGGTAVSFAGALATALLGLLARDPGAPAESSSSAGWDPVPAASQQVSGPARQQAKLGAWALIALLLPLPWLQGCTGTGVAQDIVNWTPSLQSAVATVDSTAAIFAPADAAIFTAATAGFDAASNVVVNQAKAYLANPTALTLGQLQTQIVTFQQQVNAALLASAKIVNAASQQHAMAAIQGVATIVNSILSLVESVSTKAQVAQMAAASSIKLAAVEPYLNASQAAAMVAAHYHEPVATAQVQVARVEQAEMQAGF